MYTWASTNTLSKTHHNQTVENKEKILKRAMGWGTTVHARKQTQVLENSFLQKLYKLKDKSLTP